MARPRIYADETHTGRLAPSLRGLASVTIAAHCSSDDGFDWLQKFRHDFFPKNQELKSQLVLAEIGVNERARDFLLKRIELANIVIIDFAEHTKDLIGNLLSVTGNESEVVNSLTAFLKSGCLPQEIANRILRFARMQTIDCSAVGRVERLLRQATGVSAVPCGPDGHLFDKESLFNLSEPEFKELVVRFSVALGEALRPEKQADRIIEELARHRLPHEGHVAMVCLESATEADAVFDQGCANAFRMLQEADQKIREAIDHWSCRDDVTRSSRLIQEDSRKLLGLQAADITAGYAAQIFEQADTDTASAANVVHSFFSNVLLNDRWLK